MSLSPPISSPMYSLLPSLLIPAHLGLISPLLLVWLIPSSCTSNDPNYRSERHFLLCMQTLELCRYSKAEIQKKVKREKPSTSSLSLLYPILSYHIISYHIISYHIHTLLLELTFHHFVFQVRAVSLLLLRIQIFSSAHPTAYVKNKSHFEYITLSSSSSFLSPSSSSPSSLLPPPYALSSPLPPPEHTSSPRAFPAFENGGHGGPAMQVSKSKS